MNKPIFINPTVFGFYKDNKHLRNLVLKFLKNNFDNMSVKNRQTGWRIEFNKLSFKKLVSGALAEYKFLSYSKIDEIINESILFDAKIDKQLRKEIVCFYWFMCLVNVKGSTFCIRFSVIYNDNSKRYIYSGHLDIKEKYPGK